MNQTARIATATPYMDTGFVRAVRDDLFDVVGGMGLIRARRAAGCLLVPQQGDRVLLLLDPQTCYILHVLDSAATRTDTDNAGATVLLPARTTVRTAESADSALHLASESVTLAANTLDLRAKDFSAQAETLSLKAIVLRMAGRTLCQSFASVHNLFTHLYEKAKQRIGHYGNTVRKVEELDQSSAGRVRSTVRDSLRVRSGSVSLQAEQSVEIDGKHINIG